MNKVSLMLQAVQWDRMEVTIELMDRGAKIFSEDDDMQVDEVSGARWLHLMPRGLVTHSHA